MGFGKVCTDNWDSNTVATTESTATRKVSNVTEHGKRMAEERKKPYSSLREFFSCELGPTAVERIKSEPTAAVDYGYVAQAKYAVRNLGGKTDDEIGAELFELANQGVPSHVDTQQNDTVSSTSSIKTIDVSLGSDGVLPTVALNFGGHRERAFGQEATNGNLVCDSSASPTGLKPRAQTKRSLPEEGIPDSETAEHPKKSQPNETSSEAKDEAEDGKLNAKQCDDEDGKPKSKDNDGKPLM